MLKVLFTCLAFCFSGAVAICDDKAAPKEAIDFRDVPAELQGIALSAQTEVQRLREQFKHGAVSEEELHEAEIALLEALISGYTAARRNADVIQQLEQLVKVRQRVVTRIDQFVEAGCALSSEATAARNKRLEAENRLRKARETATK